jgi:hypothetical protein
MATQFADTGIQDEVDAWEKIKGAASGVIAELEGQLREVITARSAVETRWLEDLRQFHGVYEPEIEAVLRDPEQERSRAFINMTRPKTTAWQARLSDLLFPADEKNYGISPTPVPELMGSAEAAAKEAQAHAEQAQSATEESNQMIDQGADQGQVEQKQLEATKSAMLFSEAKQKEAEARSVMMEAKKRAKAMEMEVDDQLTESRYPAACRDVLDDATKVGIGIIKGPITAEVPPRKWQQDESGVYVMDMRPRPRPQYRKVDYWHFFPDNNATSMANCEFTFERHLKNATELKRMAKALSFHQDTVRELIENLPHMDGTTDLNYLTQLRALEGNIGSVDMKKYIVWEYHGPLEIKHISDMMRALGRSEDADKFEDGADPLDERQVVIYFCSGQLLKIAEEYPLDSGETMYSVYSFEKAESTIFGAVGVPRLMKHEQSMLNSAVRMMMDNGSLSIGPQIVIDKARVEPENGSWKLTPRKVWKSTGSDISNQEPFRTYNIPMNQAQLQGIIELALKFTDEVISMPNIAQGEQGAHVTQTSSGMAMLFNSANVVFRRSVKNWDDDLTAPTIRRAFEWNMQFNDKEEIKGDMQIEARGSSVLLVREVQSQQLMVIAERWSNHPILGPAIKAYETLRLTIQTLAINPDDILCTADEFEKRLADIASQEQTSPEQIRADASIKVAQLTSESHAKDNETHLQVAEVNRQIAIMGLVQKDGVSMAQIEAMLARAKIDTDSKERMFAAEVAVEEKNADEARAAGDEPTGSGGFVSMGGKHG